MKPLRLEQLSKKWKKVRYPVPNVRARISRGYLMVVDFLPESLRPRWVQAQVLAARVHPVLALPVDRKVKNIIQIENLKR